MKNHPDLENLFNLIEITVQTFFFISIIPITNGMKKAATTRDYRFF
jgi:hypothetical protein